MVRGWGGGAGVDDLGKYGEEMRLGEVQGRDYVHNFEGNIPAEH